MIARSVFACFALGLEIALSSLLSAEESRARPTAVTRQEAWQAVASELRDRGLLEAQLPRVEDLDLPVALPALAGRRLRVSSACWDQGPRRTQFRLQCRGSGQCLPFLVYVRAFPGDDQIAVSCRLPSPPPAPETALQPLMRAGDRATAVFVADRLRMTARVTCLERGGEGEVIRVRSQDGYIFRARISGPARLEVLPR